MRILKLTTQIVPVIATATKGTKSDRVYLNIKHGTIGNDLWMWTASMSYRYFKGEKIGDQLVLNADNYCIKPIVKNGEVTKDPKGNVHFTIVEDEVGVYANDILLLWQLPHNGYNNVKVHTEGEVDIVGLGYNGRERATVQYKTPAPVVEIMGDCTLSWTGTDKKNNHVKQVITYDYDNGEWDIGDIIITEVTKDEDRS